MSDRGDQVRPRRAFLDPPENPFEDVFRPGPPPSSFTASRFGTEEVEDTRRLPKLLPAEPAWAEPSPTAAKHASASQEEAVEVAVTQPKARITDTDNRRLRASLGLTALSTVLPGAGLLWARKPRMRAFGTTVVTLELLAVLGLALWTIIRPDRVLALAVKPSVLNLVTASTAGFAVFWVLLITLTHISTRPAGLPKLRRAIGAFAVMVLSFAVAAPLAVVSRYSFDQRSLVEAVFADEAQVTSDSRPTLGHHSDPWAEIPRLNILLLGGDSASSRDAKYGVRTDTIMVASIDTKTGETVIVQIPRNLQYTPFPSGSELAERFPNGFTGEGDSASWFINALWLRMDDYPSLLEGQTYRGAEALKLGVQGITGLKIDYFVLLNIDGIQRLIDAMGGVTVNINTRLPVGGDTQGREPVGYLEPGPNQHLNGYDAMWYARSRRDSDDYHRMARQSCLVKAIIDQANPQTMLTSYEAIAAASADMVLTDIPQQVLDPLVGLSLKVKDASITRVVFAPGKNGYDYAEPDFFEMHRSVQEAINSHDEPQTTPSATTGATTGTSSPSETTTTSPPDSDEPEQSTAPSTNSASPLVEGEQDVADACAYHPKDE